MAHKIATALRIVWNDPDAGPRVEIVYDAALIREHGVRVKLLNISGATSHEQVARLGRWMFQMQAENQYNNQNDDS